MRNLLYVLLSVVFYIKVSAQLSTYYFQPNFFFDNAENHYIQEAYRGAQYDFNQLINFNSDLNYSQKQMAELYSASSSLLYGDKYAIEEFQHYIEKYPEAPINEQAYYAAGMYYTQQGDFEKAMEYLSKVKTAGFSEDRENNFNFTLGYLYFQNQDYDKALVSLNKVESKDPYTKAKEYMLGHIAYTKNDYNGALQHFDKIKQDPKYQALLQPYLVQIFFNKGEYEQASKEGQLLIQSGMYPNLKTELSKIVGESEFRLGNYLQATPFLQTYIDSASNPSLPDYYQMGYVYYIQGDYNKAVEYFNKIINEDSQLAQNAFYQLGNAYIKNKQKKEALSAYRSASQMSYDKDIQEKAMYQYALLSYDIGNPYESTPQAIQSYITKYPRSSHLSQMQNMLVQSYLYTNNYKGAMESLEKMNNKSTDLQKTEQTVSLFYGIDLYNQSKYAEAITLFNTSLQYNFNPEYNAKAEFWRGESFYQIGNYQEALKSFKKVESSSANIEEKRQLPYEMGYCYMKLENFEESEKYFKKYLQNPNAGYQDDAQLRLADSYYGNQKIDNAINMYGEVANANDENSEMAAFQQARLLGMKGDTQKQIAAYQSFIRSYPESAYVEEAHYELGLAYQESKDYLKSIVEFDKVLESKKSSQLVALSMIGKGNSYAEMNEDTRALNTYKDVAKEFKNTNYAKQAVLASKSVYLKQGNISGYESFAKQNGVNITNEESEELHFLDAEKFYNDRKYPEAISKLKVFVTSYPNSTKKLDAEYMLGDAYYKTENDEEALKYLDPIAKKQNEHQESALASVGRIYIDQQNDQEAKLAYEALYKLTQNPNYKNTAELELMYIYDEEGILDKANEMAQKVLDNSKNSETIKEQAKVIQARYAFSQNPDSAKAKYAQLKTAKNSSVKAEAYYYEAYYQNKTKSYTSSNDTIFKLTSELSDEQYWGAKALILMANNYHHLGDNYQASYILDQVIENYSDYPDLVAEANKEKTKLNK